MVKGVSRQVILVQSPDPKLFEQAIFILRTDASQGITDEMLLQEAKQATMAHRRSKLSSGPICACGGAACMALVWLLTVLL